MCLGIPMRVLEPGEWAARCGVEDMERQVSLALVGPQSAGTWLLVQQDLAREVLSEDDADKISQALQGVAAALRGETDLSQYFPDLIDRVPEAPGT